MKAPQVINISTVSLLNPDSVMAFDGDSIIDDTTQVPITSGSISIQLDLFDITIGSALSSVETTMSYQSGSKFWTTDIATLMVLTSLYDRHKYVGRVSELSPYSKNMREFKIMEFAIDNESFDSILALLPYQVEIGGGVAKINWYDSVSNFGDSEHIIYTADAYEGGTGTTYAQDPSRVTHRGAVTVPYGG